MRRVLLSVVLASLLICSTVPPASAQAVQATLSNERIVLRTDLGDIVIALYLEDVPNTGAQMLALARAGVFTGTDFFRVEPNFVVQLDPNRREPPLSDDLKALLRKQKLESKPGIVHRKGVVSLARHDGDPDSGTGSFSVLLRDSPHLDGKYTVFGEVVAGMDVAQAIAAVPLSGNRPHTRQAIREVVVTDAAGVANLAPRPTTTIARTPQSKIGPWVKIETNYGDMIVEADNTVAKHYAQFMGLAQADALRGAQFGRVKAAFYAQLFGNTSSVDPARIQPSLLAAVPFERGASNVRGSLTMDSRDGRTGLPAITFLMVDSPHLDETHTVVGRVINGISVLDAIAEVKVDKDLKPKQPVTIERMSVITSQADLSAVSLRSSRVAPSGPSNSDVLLVLGVAQGLLALAIAVLGTWLSRPQIKALALLSVLGAGVMAWIALVPRSQSHDLLSIALFLGAIGMFRLMRNYETRAPSS